jgi:hypothetical protein
MAIPGTVGLARLMESKEVGAFSLRGISFWAIDPKLTPRKAIRNSHCAAFTVTLRLFGNNFTITLFAKVSHSTFAKAESLLKVIKTFSLITNQFRRVGSKITQGKS